MLHAKSRPGSIASTTASSHRADSLGHHGKLGVLTGGSTPGHQMTSSTAPGSQGDGRQPPDIVSTRSTSLGSAPVCMPFRAALYAGCIWRSVSWRRFATATPLALRRTRRRHRVLPAPPHTRSLTRKKKKKENLSTSTQAPARPSALQGAYVGSPGVLAASGSGQRYTAGISTGMTTLSSLGGPRPGAVTVNQGTAQGQLVTALDNILYSDPPELFAQRYLLVNERATGGQAVVQVRVGACMCHRKLWSLFCIMAHAALEGAARCQAPRGRRGVGKGG